MKMKPFKFLLIAAVAVIVATACTPRYKTFTPLPFDEREYNALPKTGTGVVKGQVFAKTKGGDVKKGAGNNVMLIPATSYGTQRYREQIIGGKFTSIPEDSRYAKYVLETITDGDGRFTFNNVPPGKYYAVSHITWQVIITNRYYPVTETQGGKVHKEIEIKNGQTIEVILTL